MAEAIDWSECPLVEVIPGKVSGAPLLKSTRLPVEAILDNYDAFLTQRAVARPGDGGNDRLLSRTATAEVIEALLGYLKTQKH